MCVPGSNALLMKIAVFTKNRLNPAYDAARLGAERAAARLGAQVTHYVPEVADDAAEQSALLERALADRPNAIALATVHPTRVDAAIRKVNAAGIPLVGFISRSDAGKWDCFIGADNCRVGAGLAAYLFAQLSGKGSVAIIHAAADSPTSNDRARGFRDAAAKCPGIRIAGTGNGEYQFEPARREMTRLLADVAHIDGVLAANDVMALGAIEALQAAGRSALVVGVNGIPDAIDAVKRGTLLATADFSAMSLGALATECAILRVRGEAVPAEIMLPVEIIDRSNVGAWDLPYERRPCLELAEALRIGVKR